jgi:hypothetical protein
MTRRVAWIALAAAVVAALLAWLLLGGGRVPRPPAAVIAVEPPTPTPAPEQRILLLFTADDGLLHPELRSVPLPADVQERVRVVVRELLAGSAEQRPSPVPYPATLLGVYVDQAGHAFVDLSPPPTPLGGAQTELLFAYAVVDSVLFNCPELRAVQLLFGGREVTTLTGHLDLSHPLALNKAFIGTS